MNGRRAVVSIALALAASLGLGACAADRGEAVDSAQEVFDSLVAVAEALGPDRLRTLEIGEPGEQVCGPDTDAVTLGLIATGTIPVAAEATVLDEIAVEIIASLDPADWSPITTTGGADQRAVQDASGTTATVTTTERSLVIAVFTPCIPPVD